MNKRLITVSLLGVLIGFLIGFKMKPERVIDTSELDEKVATISKLQERIKTLTQENTKVKTVTVTVERPDGTKTTTRTKDLERLINEVRTVENDKVKNNVKEKSVKTTKTTINSSNHNAVGLTVASRVDDIDIQPAVFIRTGRRCFIFSCGVILFHGLRNKQTRLGFNVAYRF